MGDKSPKAKDKQKKQQTADKNQKDAATKARAAQRNTVPDRKGK
jgi:hypothetical protein